MLRFRYLQKINFFSKKTNSDISDKRKLLTKDAERRTWGWTEYKVIKIPKFYQSCLDFEIELKV